MAKGDEQPQDPHVERLRPNPSEPPQRTRTLVGFLGDSDRPGMRRLYFSPALDHYAEFRTEDALSLTPVPPEQSPFPGHQVTEATLRRDATVDYTHTHTPAPLDEFDLDVRLTPSQAISALPTQTVALYQCGTVINTYIEGCRLTLEAAVCRPTLEGTFCRVSEYVLCIPTRVTCPTHCANTCANTCTCNTQCNQATCTCNTQCNQNTCANTCTCNTQCNQNTCANTCGCPPP
ncbi:MAG TPA: hypothetical protein VGK33_02040 [Chloroflexota bacterium]